MKRYLLLVSLIINLTYMNAQNQDPWGEYMTPSEVHLTLTQYTGSFEMQMTIPMGEGNAPTVITVDSEHIMLLGGRFLEMKQKGTMMGMDYESIMTLGFNNIDKKMALITITNMGTGTLSLFGKWDKESNSVILSGQLTNPVTKNTINVKQIVTFIDENSILIESFDQEGDNPERKTVEYRFIRKK